MFSLIFFSLDIKMHNKIFFNCEIITMSVYVHICILCMVNDENIIKLSFKFGLRFYKKMSYPHLLSPCYKRLTENLYLGEPMFCC